MQDLEGETLADRLARGALPVGEALRIAIEVARALDAAHRRGIIHRDLKPGNIMLTKTGAGSTGSPQARLLDFGLAKPGAGVFGAAAPTGLATSPLLTSPITAHGTILGTFQYMAPEQIEGDEADPRTDLFAFGAVVYEMLTGRRAFTGKTQASLIGAILKDVPAPASSIAVAVPPPLDRIVARCLAKDPDERWQTARDLTSELAWIADEKPGAFAPVIADTAAAPARTFAVWRRASWLTWVATTIVVGLLASLVTWLTIREAPAPVRRVEFSITAPDGVVIRRNVGGGVAISSDGQYVVWVAPRPAAIRACCTSGGWTRRARHRSPAPKAASRRSSHPTAAGSATSRTNR